MMIKIEIVRGERRDRIADLVPIGLGMLAGRVLGALGLGLRAPRRYAAPDQPIGLDPNRTCEGCEGRAFQIKNDGNVPGGAYLMCTVCGARQSGELDHSEPGYIELGDEFAPKVRDELDARAKQALIGGALSAIAQQAGAEPNVPAFAPEITVSQWTHRKWWHEGETFVNAVIGAWMRASGPGPEGDMASRRRAAIEEARRAMYVRTGDGVFIPSPRP